MIDKVLILAALSMAGVALRRTSNMATELEQIQSAFKDIDEFTNNVADDLDSMIAHVDNLQFQLDKVTADQSAAVQQAVNDSLAAVRNGLQTRAEALRAVANKVATPVPVVPPPEIPEPTDVSASDTSSSVGSTNATPNVGVEPGTGADPTNVDGQ